MNTDKIIEALYQTYGTDSGILFGIKERRIVETIVGFTLKKIEPSPPEPDQKGEDELDKLRRDKVYWQLEAQAKHKRIVKLEKENAELQKERGTGFQYHD